jgi:hypothetical protein
MDDCDICITDPKKIIQPEVINGSLLYCTCPVCGQKVAADIYNNTITCPACNAQAPWKE